MQSRMMLHQRMPMVMMVMNGASLSTRMKVPVMPLLVLQPLQAAALAQTRDLGCAAPVADALSTMT
jgi:hypothetical protein